MHNMQNFYHADGNSEYRPPFIRGLIDDCMLQRSGVSAFWSCCYPKCLFTPNRHFGLCLDIFTVKNISNSHFWCYCHQGLTSIRQAFLLQPHLIFQCISTSFHVQLKEKIKEKSKQGKKCLITMSQLHSYMQVTVIINLLSLQRPCFWMYSKGFKNSIKFSLGMPF